MPHFDSTFVTLPGGVRTSRFLKDVRHDLLYMTIFYLELYSSCTTLQVAGNIRMRQTAFQVGKIKFHQNGQISRKTVKYQQKWWFLVSFNAIKKFIMKKAYKTILNFLAYIAILVPDTRFLLSTHKLRFNFYHTSGRCTDKPFAARRRARLFVHDYLWFETVKFVYDAPGGLEYSYAPNSFHVEKIMFHQMVKFH